MCLGTRYNDWVACHALHKHCSSLSSLRSTFKDTECNSIQTTLRLSCLSKVRPVYNVMNGAALVMEKLCLSHSQFPL